MTGQSALKMASVAGFRAAASNLGGVMLMPSRAHKLIGLTSRIALMLGISAFSAAGARADAASFDRAATPSNGPQPGAAAALVSAELHIWSEAGRIYTAEQGRAARELPLGDTAEAVRLRALLEQRGATDAGAGVRLDRMLLAGGGGEGFSWTLPGRAANAGRPAATPAAESTRVPLHDRPLTATRRASGATANAPNGHGADGH
jgi:hypothetical protein